MSKLLNFAKKIEDSQGNKKTLSRGQSAFIKFDFQTFDLAYSPSSCNQMKNEKKSNIKDIVFFFGLGFNACEDLTLFNIDTTYKKIYYIECEDFEKSCNKADISCSIPSYCKKITKEEALLLIEENIKTCDLFLYRQNLTLFPSFWNSFLMDLETLCLEKNNTSQKNSSQKKTIYLGSHPHDLMYKEIMEALKELDYFALNIPLSQSPVLDNSKYFADLASLIRKEKPELFLSINGKNLDVTGRIFSLLQHLKIPLALWIVDNVWNILSKFKQDWWKECHLFVTDSSFIPLLKEYGAKYVYSLPLGSGEMNIQQKQTIILQKDILYIGNYSFNDKDKFFSAVRKEKERINFFQEKIINYYNKLQKKLINFHDIYKILSPQQEQKLWGNNDFRTISYYTVETDSYNKSYWLNKLSSEVNIIGGDEWKTVLKNCHLLPRIDYYNQLPYYYKEAKFTLNITSLLMPSALTQRHFDVWRAGGFLLTTNTKGLEIFPQDLINEIIAQNPEEVLTFKEKYLTDEKLYQEIKTSMQEIIIQNHSYTERLKSILECIN